VQFSFIAAGIPSLGSLPHAFRVQQDVLDKAKVDLLFVEAAINDQTNGTDSLTQIRALEGIIRHAKHSNPQMDIVMMAFAEPSNIQQYERGKIPLEVKNQELLAGHYQLPSINMSKLVRDKIAAKEFNWADDFKDLHPSPFGQELYYSAIKSLFTTCFQQPQSAVSFFPPALNTANFEQGKYLGIDNAQLDNNWKIDSNWTPTDGLPTRDGFVKRPMLVATTPGSQFNLAFKGTAIGIVIVSGGDAGMLEYAIDGKPYAKLDLHTLWSGQLHLPWYLILGADLKPGKHTLNLKISADKNANSKGTACWIVYFLLNE
jgi:sialidase-1